ncbi:TspO/MBR family protein [Aquabacter cavernae]|uniref:TspO/MBR family protein n=1 Tax=Aquabacter cavernae TaxID=2496029 RepID=UPI001FDF7395|nr:TspO/MBR family protein [Aquabacter cavernae]
MMRAFLTPRLSLAVCLLRLFACALLLAGVSGLGAAVTYPEIASWYAGLAKPGWTPPNFAFPIVWTALYGLMAIALWRLWDRAVESPARLRALGLFLAQLALNALWSPVFFGLHAPGPAFVIILALIACVAATLRAAFKADEVAGWLLVPYLPWLCYAAALNGAILFLN